MLGDTLEFTYTNYKGETSKRQVRPNSLWFGSTKYHKEKQWLLSAFDIDKDAFRDFALNDIVGKNINLTATKISHEPIMKVGEWHL